MIFLFILFSLFNCCEKPSSDPHHQEPINSFQPEIIWKHQYSETEILKVSLDAHLTNNLVITSHYSFNEENETVLALDRGSGDLIWQWQDYLSPNNENIYGTESAVVINNVLIASAGQENYGIDLTSGSTIWQSYTENGDKRLSTFGNQVFHVARYGNSPFADSAKTFACDYLTGQWESIYTISGVDYNPALYLPAGYTNDEGETLLIFQNQGITFNPFDERVDLHCYNLTQDSLVWYKPNFTPSGSSNTRAPVVEGDVVYFAGKWDMYCIDILSGEVLWTHNFYWDYQNSNFILYNNLLITNLDNGDLIAIDKHTGEQVWVNEGLSGCCTELRTYGDRIYFANSNLFIVDATNGQKLYELDSPHNGSFSSAIAVDLESQKMYASDGFYFMCMKLPE